MRNTIGRVLLLSAMGLLFFCHTARAQFYMTGSTPPSVRWSKMDTENFRIIYPSAMDSLARVYGTELERARLQHRWSTGMLIGQNYSGRMPVLLHASYSQANASVTWAPRRMDIQTVNDAYSPTPFPWVKHLAIHEGRHAADLQFSSYGWLKVFHFFFGEMADGAFAGIYPGLPFLEGNAVVAETALTSSGRGRQASFLNYFMPAFDCGDYRDYWQWVYGSLNSYAPDYYRAGYILTAGTRVFFDDPLLTDRYYSRVIGKGGFMALKKTIYEASGADLKATFAMNEMKLHELWDREAAERAPFMPSVQATPRPRIHTEYSNPIGSISNGLFAVKSGLADAPSLVRIGSDGRESRVRAFTGNSTTLNYDPERNRIWWTEHVPNWRWTMKSDSQVRYADAGDPKKIRTFLKGGKYYNAQPSPDGGRISVTEYPNEGGSRLLVLDVDSKEVLESYPAPDSLQFTESAWTSDGLFVLGLSDGGIGIYRLAGRLPSGKASLKKILSPEPVEMDSFKAWPGGHDLMFACDRTGVKELYRLDPDSGEVFQITSTRYGIEHPSFNASKDSLYYCSYAASDDPESYRQGRMVYATAVADLPVRKVDFGDIHRYWVADRLSEQERMLAGDEWGGPDTLEVEFSEPARYSKIRFPHIHSWAPVYFNYDSIEDFSSDEIYKTVSAGATALFQNLRGDGYGFLGYSWHNRNSLHFQYTYAGLVPYFELSVDWGDRNRYLIQRYSIAGSGSSRSVSTRANITGTPYLHTTINAYVPISLNSGGLSKGIIPQLEYSFTNDRYNDAIILAKRDQESGKLVKEGTLGEDSNAYFSTLTASVRGYVMRKTAPSQVYPSLGIGVEFGYRVRPGNTQAYDSRAYAYVYGYLPGLSKKQGIRLSFTGEVSAKKSEYGYTDATVSTVPRGFSDSNLSSVYSRLCPYRIRATFDYAIPFLSLDWSGLCPLAYVKNLEARPFFDYSWQKYSIRELYGTTSSNLSSSSMFSVGTDLEVVLGNLLWLPYECKAGIRIACNGWSSSLEHSGISGLNRWYIGGLFSIDL